MRVRSLTRRPPDSQVAAGVKAPPEKIPALVHNEIVAKTLKRADALEQRMVDVIQPLFEEAGKKAADAFLASVTNHLTAAGLDVAPDATMVALKPRPDEAEALAVESGIPADRLHVTLALLGGTDGDLADVRDALRPVAASYAPLAGVVAGAGFFGEPDEGGPTILLPDVRGLVEVRTAVTEALVEAGVDYARDHGYQAHITVSYRDDGEGETDDDWPVGAPLHFDAILIVRGDEVVFELPLVGVPALTAASNPPNWSAPYPDEVVDVPALTAKIKAKTDPVRQGFLQAAMTPALAAAGLAFDVTNPFTAKVLAGSGSKITNIAETTQLNVMRIIGSAYDNGLSIPQTASLIQAGMSAASGARATMIARTELAAAVNGGSLAATQIVSDATGSGYMKRWLTAPGATYPRHELYDGLDGQTVALEDVFDVGGSPLSYPGDPDGDPGESINCVAEGSRVVLPGLLSAMRRWYEGDLVQIRFASGDDLAVTPNHPILRADGSWTPARLLVEGDYCVRGRPVGGLLSEPDEEDVPPEVGEVYRLTRMAGDPERVCLSPPDLHGDGGDSEVDVVAVDRLLRFDRKPASDEEVVKLGLAFADQARARFGAREGRPEPERASRTRRRSLSAASRVRGGGEPLTLLARGLLHTEEHRFASTSDRDVALLEAPKNGRPADAVPLCEREDALSSFEVTLDEIVDIDVQPSWAGFVFNFDTGHGFYLTSNGGGILVRNCRCTLAYDDATGEHEADSEETPEFDVGGDGETAAVANAIPAPATAVPDTVSVNSGPPIPAEIVQKIQAHNLDVPLTDDSPPTTKFGRDFAARVGGNNTKAAYAPTGEWDPARRELHQEIIDAHFAGKVATGDTPTAYFTSGGGASGKSAAPFTLPDGSTLTPKLFSDLEAAGTAPTDTVLIDPDRIKLMLPEYGILRDAGDLHAAAFVHEESSALANEIRVEAQRRGLSMLVDTTGSSDGFLVKLGEAKAAGYDVKVTMFSTPTNEAIVRAMARGDKSGRYVSTWALKHAHSGASKQLGIWENSPLVKEWKVFDNSTRPPTLVAEGGLGKRTVYDQQAFDAILAKATEKSAVPSTLTPAK